MTHDILSACGSPLKVKGRSEFRIEIVQFLCNQGMIVAELNIDGVIGLDFLQRRSEYDQ